jgi:hypothetical protein
VKEFCRNNAQMLGIHEGFKKIIFAVGYLGGFPELVFRLLSERPFRAPLGCASLTAAAHSRLPTAYRIFAAVPHALVAQPMTHENDSYRAAIFVFAFIPAAASLLAIFYCLLPTAFSEIAILWEREEPRAGYFPI